MTAPGNTVLIVTLLAAFVACSGYAAGRLHQRRQTGRDREEAYRDGYENATRSVFSLAARIIGPRRASARGSAAVGPSAETGATTALPSPAPPGPAAPRASSPAVSPALSRAGLPSVPPGSPILSSAGRSSAPPTSPPDPPAPVVAGEPGPASRRSAADLGFPAPPPPPPSVRAEPAAVGGVTYQPFPDPRLAEHHRPEDPAGDSPSPTPTVVARASPAAKEQRARRRAIHRAADDGPEAAEQAEPGNDAPGSPGRHTVPDELVRATTYRLPADRVFRAKVRETPGSPGLPDESTTRLVPKPRES